MMANIDVAVFDSAICDGCPEFDVESVELFACGVVFERTYQCKNLSLCRNIIPRVKHYFEDTSAQMEGGGK